ncbi:MAG TPA: hypothetical protein VIQ31_25275 [Phormidium sp.]
MLSACRRCRQGRDEGIDTTAHDRKIDRVMPEKRMVLAFVHEEPVAAIA